MAGRSGRQHWFHAAAPAGVEGAAGKTFSRLDDDDDGDDNDDEKSNDSLSQMWFFHFSSLNKKSRLFVMLYFLHSVNHFRSVSWILKSVYGMLKSGSLPTCFWKGLLKSGKSRFDHFAGALDCTGWALKAWIQRSNTRSWDLEGWSPKLLVPYV